LYEKFKTENPQCKVSKSSFIKVETALGVCKGKGVVDGCSICFSQNECSKTDIFLRKEHQKLVMQDCRAIRTIREFLPKGFLCFVLVIVITDFTKVCTTNIGLTIYSL
jgi:hypothetical protein